MLLASPQPEACYSVLSQIMGNFYAPILRRHNKVDVVEFNRALPNNIERFRTYVQNEVKIVCPVRSVPEILASFISLIHRNSDRVSFVDQYLLDSSVEVNDNTRCDYLMSDYGIVGQAMFALSRAYVRNEQHLLHIVEYDELVEDPQSTLRAIYDFWGAEWCPGHYFSGLENPYPENDIFQYNLNGMHTIAPRVEKVAKPPGEVLSNDIIEKYSGLEFWRGKSVCTNNYYLNIS